MSAGQYGAAEQRHILFNFYRLVVARITSGVGVRIVDVVHKKLFPNRKGIFFHSVEGFDKILNSMIAASEKLAVFYSHFTFSHWPIDFDENCADRSNDASWFHENQNKSGLKKVAICGMRKYSELLSHLKRMGIYDNSTIILMSDHGMIWRYYDTHPGNLTINNA